ncbi:MAG TPA: ParA family protein, partial [Methylocella sp.]|nr:ParA family protein [Methylocella sp.]
MRTIVFATQKGGSSKSTLAACLAVAAQSAGERVFVFDLDPKKCLVRWGVKRNDRSLPVRDGFAGQACGGAQQVAGAQHYSRHSRYPRSGLADVARCYS